MASNSDKSDLEDGEIEDGEILESESEGEVEDKDTSESPSPQQTLKRSRSSGEEDTDTSIPIPPAKREKHDRVNHDREVRKQHNFVPFQLYWFFLSFLFQPLGPSPDASSGKSSPS
eukprot:scpid74708/ scgid3646/ 